MKCNLVFSSIACFTHRRVNVQMLEILVIFNGVFQALWDLAERIGEAKGSGLRKRDLKSLKTTKFDSKSVENSELTDCRVCITDFEDGDTVTTLPCGHRYHKGCIETWLRVSQGHCKN